MNFVTIKNEMSGNPIKMIFLQGMEEMPDYESFLNGRADEACTSSRQEIETHGVNRLDHMTHPIKEVKTLAITGGVLSQFNGFHPIISTKVLVAKKLIHMKESLTNGKSLLVNERGGYMTYRGEEIIEQNLPGWNYEPLDYTFLTKGAKVLNLENDFELEEKAISRMESMWGEFSYIVNMKFFTSEDLDRVFADFKEQGGEAVYVYSTFGNSTQQALYCNCVANAGLSLFLEPSIKHPHSLWSTEKLLKKLNVKTTIIPYE